MLNQGLVNARATSLLSFALDLFVQMKLGGAHVPQRIGGAGNKFKTSVARASQHGILIF